MTRRWPQRGGSIGRRGFLQSGLAGLAVMMGAPLAGCGSDGGSERATPEPGPKPRSNFANIGPLGGPNDDGVRVPDGFSARVIARSGELVPGTDFEWHSAPDGGAVFAHPDGGWVYVSNSEVPLAGGVGALRFDADGAIIGAYAILDSTNVNCAGGVSPRGTWLSCEEVPRGKVFECDPLGERPAEERLALGVFKHEAAAFDLDNAHVYLSEDEGDGRFYRFVPDRLLDDGSPDLSSGTLEVARVNSDDSVDWLELPDPEFTGSTPTREQVPESTAFDGGEGIWWFDGVVYLTTKGDDRVWAYDVAAARMSVLYDAEQAQDPILTGVDNLIGSFDGDLLVAEDGGDMQVVAILPDGTLKPLAQVVGHDTSEITGLAFDPTGTRLYFNSQRGDGSGGVTYEVTGPFHVPAE